MGRHLQPSLFAYTPVNLLTEEEAFAIVEPHREAFCDCCLKGAADWYRFVLPEGRKRLRSITRSVCVSDFVREHIKDHFRGVEGAVLCQRLGFLKLFLGDRVVIRAKKLTAEYLAMPPRTEQGHAWFCNEPLPGVPSSYTRLTVGFLTTPDDAEVLDVAITFQLSLQTLGWKRSILRDADIRRVHEHYATSDEGRATTPIPLNVKTELVPPTGKEQA